MNKTFEEEKDFIEMWREADIVDAEIGGMDSIPENEWFDYSAACGMALAEDFDYGLKVKEQRNKRMI